MHAHPVVNLRASQMPSAASLIAAMDARGIARTVLSPPLTTSGDAGTDTYGATELSALVRQAPDRLAFAAGGEVLNQMLQRTAASDVTLEDLARFRAEALAIVRAGAVAFAELGAEVFAAGKNMPGGHTHQTSPADHPFLLALAGIAADSDMPIGLHMEAITAGAGQVPNIAAFERLLAANRLARIVWLHAGWDRTGQRSAGMMQSLLQQHPNLFMTLGPFGRGRQCAAGGGWAVEAGVARAAARVSRPVRDRQRSVLRSQAGPHRPCSPDRRRAAGGPGAAGRSRKSAKDLPPAGLSSSDGAVQFPLHLPVREIPRMSIAPWVDARDSRAIDRKGILAW